jgi:hypothetical protein
MAVPISFDGIPHIQASGLGYLSTDANGNILWITGLPGVTVGGAVGSGTANRILYEDASNQLAESANLTFDGTNTKILGGLGIGTAVTGTHQFDVHKLNPGGSHVFFAVGDVLTVGKPLVYFMADSTAAHSTIKERNDNKLFLGNQANPEAFVVSGAKIGVNTSSPGAMVHATAVDATTVGLTVELAAAQTANAFEVTSNGGASGGLLHVTSSGFMAFGTVEGTANITRKWSREVHTLSLATTSDTTTISIPSGSRLLAVQMNVDVAVTDGAGDDTWSAAFVTGSTTTIVSGAAAAQNTKVNFMVPDEITSGIAEIRFTPNGGSFSAGQIEVLAYYETLTSMANA